VKHTLYSKIAHWFNDGGQKTSFLFALLFLELSTIRGGSKGKKTRNSFSLKPVASKKLKLQI
jgi:prophage maintenance system killer protein